MRSSISSSRFARWAAATAGAGLLGFAALLGASEFLVRYRVEPNDHFWRHVSIFHSSKSGHAVFGDSIPARGFHGVDGFVNLAMPGESPPITELKAATYFKSRTPENVIISLNPNIFRRSASVPLEEFKDVYVTRREPLLKVFKHRHKLRMLGYWMVWLSNRPFHNNVYVPPEGGILMRDLGSNLNYANQPDSRRLEQGARNVARDAIAEDFRLHDNLKIIGRIVALVRANGGTACLVTFPYSPEYRQAARKYARFDEARAFFASFAQGLAVRYVDFWQRYDDSRLFLDPSHLSEAGSRRFTPEVVRECFGEKLGPASGR